MGEQRSTNGARFDELDANGAAGVVSAWRP